VEELTRVQAEVLRLEHMVFHQWLRLAPQGDVSGTRVRKIVALYTAPEEV
jgi:hypothetical protein